MLKEERSKGGAALLIDARQTAERLRISERSWLRLVERGEAPAPIRLGRLVRWRIAEIEAWIAGKGAQL